MNMFKKNGGFTLVELIVVIAILAILAGVAVPAYSGYITKAKDAKVVSELSAVLTAAQADAAANYEGAAVNKIVVTSTGITVTIEAGDTDKTDTDLSPFYTGTIKDMLAGTSYASGANWTPANGWKAGTT